MKLPLFATSATSTPCSFAINPRKENITTPANIDVHEFTVQIISASLKYLFHFFESYKIQSYVQSAFIFCQGRQT